MSNLSEHEADELNKETTNVEIQHMSGSSSDHHAPAPPERTSFKARTFAFIEKYWVIESLGLVLALGSLFAIVGLLTAYDGEKAPNWNPSVHVKKVNKTFPITINAIISIFATTYSSGLMIPVAACMSQLKWVWFQQGRPLADYQAFESAARGPAGSVVLLWTLRFRFVMTSPLKIYHGH
jgi:uncharacterized membrane protein